MKKSWVILDLSLSHIVDKGFYAFAYLTEEEQENLPYTDNSVIEVVWWSVEEADEEDARESASKDGYPVDSMYTFYEDDVNLLFSV